MESTGAFDNGQSTFIKGPDGTSVLIDVGKKDHRACVRKAVSHHNGEAAVDWVVLTHWHKDHVGGFPELFDPEDGPLTLREGVISRGANSDSDDTHVGPRGDTIAAARRGGAAHLGLCADPDCATMTAGNVRGPQTQERAFLPLGDGARLTFFAADGRYAPAQGAAVRFASPKNENDRGLAGMVTTVGGFTYLFAGDISGGGTGGAGGKKPNLEAALVAAALEDGFVPDADVFHLNHHGLRTSSSSAWLSWIAPTPKTRHALVGTNADYDSWNSEIANQHKWRRDILIGERLTDVLGQGCVWLPETDRPKFYRSLPQVVVSNGPVTVLVGRDGHRELMGGSGCARGQ